MSQRREVFEDLHNALRVMNLISDQTPIPNILYAMWLLENKQLRLGININVIRLIDFWSCLCNCNHSLYFTESLQFRYHHWSFTTNVSKWGWPLLGNQRGENHSYIEHFIPFWLHAHQYNVWTLVMVCLFTSRCSLEQSNWLYWNATYPLTLLIKSMSKRQCLLYVRKEFDN